MIYPVAVVTIAIIVVYIILWKVIPVFATLFESLGTQLPFLTQVIVNVSRFIGHFWWLIILVVIGAIFAIRQYYQTDAGRYQIDKLMLKAPVIGMLLRKIAVARFCRNLAIMTRGGVPIVSAMSVTSAVCGNRIIEKALLQVPAPLARHREPHVEGARLIIEHALGERRYTLNSTEAKAVLRAFHIPTSPSINVSSAAEALIAAESVGLPVAMKINSPDITHKSDVGGVRLNIREPRSVRTAFREMMEGVQRIAPEARDYMAVHS